MASRFDARTLPPLKYFEMVDRDSPVISWMSLYVDATDCPSPHVWCFPRPDGH